MPKIERAYKSAEYLPRNDPNLLKDPEQTEIPKVHSNPNGDKKKFSGYKKHSITGNRFGTLNLNSKAAVGSKLDKKRKKSSKDRKRNATLTNGIESEEAAAAGGVVGSLSTSTGSFRFCMKNDKSFSYVVLSVRVFSYIKLTDWIQIMLGQRLNEVATNRFLVEDESTSDTSSGSGSVNRNRRRTRSESNVEREKGDQSDTTGYNEIQWSHNKDRLI